MANFIEALNWRYATKKFDTSKKISESDLEEILTAVQLSASSYGLQLYKILIINNIEMRANLQPATWGQSQTVDASHLLVFCAKADVVDADIDEYIALKAETSGINPEDLKGYGDFMKSKIVPMPTEQKKAWTSRQTYIALGNLLSACALKEIDACPMEGFEVDKYDEILGLSEQGYMATVVATIGYRSAEDQTQHAPKVRKSKERLFQVI